jgi:hypothetical protein
MKDGKPFDLNMLTYDAAKLEAKLHAFDTWLWSDCDVGGQHETSLQIDSIEASRGSSALDEKDPPLFRGVGGFASPSGSEQLLNFESAGILSTSTGLSLMLENRKPQSCEHADNKCAEMCLQNVSPKPLLREVPEETKDQRTDVVMQARADEMKERMCRRSQDRQIEFERQAKKLQAWLAKNNFFSVNSKKSSFWSFTYPLHVAAANNDIEILQLLILQEADPAALDSKGRTPLQVAAKKCKKGSHRKAVAKLTAVS